jgi:hypothetical protein
MSLRQQVGWYNAIGANTWAAIKAINPNVEIYLYEMGAEIPCHLDGMAQVYLNGLGRHNIAGDTPWAASTAINLAFFCSTLRASAFTT